jgi:hypothetical protein
MNFKVFWGVVKMEGPPLAKLIPVNRGTGSRLSRAEVGRPRVGRAHYNIRWRGLETLGWLVRASQINI